MIPQSQLEAYRRMPQEERWREVEALMTLAWRWLQTLPHEEVARRIARDREEHNKADEVMLAKLRSRLRASCRW